MAIHSDADRLTATESIRELARERLDGRTPDIVGFVDELLAMFPRLRRVTATLTTDGEIRFEVPDEEPSRIRLLAGKWKLRAICANLAVRCGFDEPNSNGTLFGGHGIIAGLAPISVTTENTPSDQWFVLKL